MALFCVRWRRHIWALRLWRYVWRTNSRSPSMLMQNRSCNGRTAVRLIITHFNVSMHLFRGLSWFALTRREGSRLEVPMDHFSQSSDKIFSIPIMRMLAKNASATGDRHIFLNPGGPGGMWRHQLVWHSLTFCSQWTGLPAGICIRSKQTHRRRLPFTEFRSSWCQWIDAESCLLLR